MNRLPRKIDFIENEAKWQALWEKQGIYSYDWGDDSRARYSIDTPPPYPSGDFHMGNVLNWTYFDMRARYKRMQGFNVHFPQGWDCHGLPTEVAVEKAKGIRRSDLPPDQFRTLCEEWIEEYIAVMKEAVIRLGCSVDWSLEYRTMEPQYIGKVQKSFLILYDNTRFQRRRGRPPHRHNPARVYPLLRRHRGTPRRRQVQPPHREGGQAPQL
jgi:valyl-tRNA synthetase